MNLADSYTDRSPTKSPAMRDAYAGLAEAEAALREAHAYGTRTDDWDPHHEAVAVTVEWHAEIGRLAVSRG